MEKYDLGPNGGLLFCMESLLQSISWLIDRIKALECHYFIFDCPGQVELFSHHDVVQQLLSRLQEEIDCRLCCVQLVDSYYCSQPATFISAVLLVISTMLRLGLPHVNVLSKVDLLQYYGELPFGLDFFTEMLDLMPLAKYVGKRVKTAAELDAEDGEEEEDVPPSLTPLQMKYAKMTEAICEVVSDYDLVSFLPMNIEDAQTVARVVANVDRANGYCLVEAYQQQQQGGGAVAMEGMKDTKALFQYASDRLFVESAAGLSLEIQEKYAPK